MDESWIHHCSVETKIQSNASTHWGILGCWTRNFSKFPVKGSHNLIPKLRHAIKEKWRGNLRKVVLLHQDNTQSQVRHCNNSNRSSKVRIGRASAIFSRFCSSDFWLFPKLEKHLHDKGFSPVNDVICAVNQWFAQVE